MTTESKEQIGRLKYRKGSLVLDVVTKVRTLSYAYGSGERDLLCIVITGKKGHLSIVLERRH